MTVVAQLAMLLTQLVPTLWTDESEFFWVTSRYRHACIWKWPDQSGYSQVTGQKLAKMLQNCFSPDVHLLQSELIWALWTADPNGHKLPHNSLALLPMMGMHISEISVQIRHSYRPENWQILCCYFFAISSPFNFSVWQKELWYLVLVQHLLNLGKD